MSADLRGPRVKIVQDRDPANGGQWEGTCTGCGMTMWGGTDRLWRWSPWYRVVVWGTRHVLRHILQEGLSNNHNVIEESK